MSNLMTEELLAANEAFYQAMREGDLEAMEALWARTRTATCTHPNSPSIYGRAAVMESWRVILTVHAPPDIAAADPHPVVTGETAMVICREIVGTIDLMATNTFVREGGGWRMVSHHAAPVPDA